jgi:hypothetical protein
VVEREDGDPSPGKPEDSDVVLKLLEWKGERDRKEEY